MTETAAARSKISVRDEQELFARTIQRAQKAEAERDAANHQLQIANRQYREAFGAWDKERVALQAQNRELVRIVTGALCRECAAGSTVKLNSAGYYSHREEGNHCNAHILHAALAAVTSPPVTK
jgi:hypothetical protein